MENGILIGIAVGVLATTMIVPVLQQIEAVIVNALEILNGYSTLKVTKFNVEIRKLQEEAGKEEVSTQCIGFEVPEVVYEEEEEEV